MKKRVLSVLLVIALLVAVGIVAAQADETDPTPAQIIADAAGVIQRADALTIDPADPVAVCPYCQGEAVTWTDLSVMVNEEGGKAHYGGHGHYYVDGTVESNYTFHNVSSGIPCVFLNPGSTVKVYGAATFTAGVRLMGNGNVMSATRPANEEAGTEAVNPAGYLTVSTKGTEIYGGTYSAAEGTTMANAYGGIYGHQNIFSVLNVYGGTFRDTSNGPAIGPYNGAVVNVYGGNIDTLRLTQFTGEGTGRANVYAGNITNLNACDGILTVEGGNIGTLTPTATMDSITISGNPVIGTVNTTVKATYGQLTQGASIGFGSYTGVISTAYATAPEAQAVADSFPAVPGVSVTVNDAYELVLGAKTYTPAEIATLSKAQDLGTTDTNAFCYHCGAYVDWTALTAESTIWGASELPGGHYFLAENVDNTTLTDGVLYLGEWYLPGNPTVCFHLNGHNLTSVFDKAINMWTAYTLNIMGEGRIAGSGNTLGSLGLQAEAGITNIYGGTYSGWRAMGLGGGTVNVYDATREGGHIYIPGGKNTTVNWNTDWADVRIYGSLATLSLNNAAVTELTVENGTINVGSGSTITTVKGAGNAGDLNVNGGTVGTLNAGTGTVTVNGGAIATINTGTGTVNVQAGSVNTLNATSGTVVLSGAPTITAMNVTSGITVDATGLTGGTIGLGTTSGVFTTAFADDAAAAAVIPYFYVAEEAMEITVTDAFALSYDAITFESTEDMIEFANDMVFTGNETVQKFCPHCEAVVTWKPFNDDFNSGSEGFPYLLLNIANNMGHYYLSDTVTTRTAAVLNNHTIILHLNGQTMQMDGVPALNPYQGATLTILGQGNVSSNSSTTCVGGGTIKIYGGTYSNTNTTADNPAILGQNSATAATEIYAGTFNGTQGTGDVKGQRVAFFSNGATLSVYGGQLLGSQVWLNAGTTHADTTFNLYGGTIHSFAGGDGTFNLQGGTVQAPEGTVFYLGGNEETGCEASLILGNVTFDGPSVINNNSAAGNIEVTEEFLGTVTVNFHRNQEGSVYGATVPGITAPNGLNCTVNATDVDGNDYGLFYDTVADDGSLITGRTAIIDGENKTWYADNAAAVTAYSTGIIKLYSDADLALGDKNATVDLNGQTLGKITGTGNLIGLDSATKDNFAKKPGSALLDGFASVSAPATETAADGTVSGYLAVTTENETTFSYFTMKLSGVALKAKAAQNDVGMFYKGTWSFNDYLPEGLVEAGVVVNATTAPQKDFKSSNYNGWYSMDAANITNGEAVTSILVEGIMKKDGSLTATQNDTRGNADIHAAAFVIIGDQVIMTAVRSMSICDVLTAIESNATAFEANESKLYGEGKFYDIWNAYANFATWNLPKYAENFPAA